MENKQRVKIEHPIRLTIGSVLLVIAGMSFGTYESMKYFLKLDDSSVWIPIVGVLCLLIGTGFICWGSQTILEAKQLK